MKYLSSMKAGGPVLDTKDARSAYALPAQKAGKPYRDDWDLDRAIREGLKKVIPVFRSVHVIADSQARLPFEVAQGDEEGPSIEGHALVRLLNQRPNPDEAAYTFRYRLSSQVLLSRRGAFVRVLRSRGGDPIALYLMDPTKTYPVSAAAMAGSGNLSPEKALSLRLVDHFEVDRGQGRKDEVDPSDVLWFRLPHPVDPMAGMTPLEAAGLTIDIDVLARLYNRTFLQNDGRPGGIVGVKGEMDEEVAVELDSRFNGGTRGAGRITVLEADGLDWVDTAVSPRDAQYVQALAATKVDILGAFGVPESMAYGNASQRTYDNVDAERAIFWEATELGHLALLGDGFNQVDDDDETFCRFNLDGVEALQRAKKLRREEMRAEVVAGVRTLDSYLEAIGEEPVGSAEARSFFRAMGEVPYATVGEDAPVLTLVQDAAAAAAKAVIEDLERKASRAPFRYAPPRGG